MKKLPIFFILAGAFMAAAPMANAQWKTTAYSLKGGWNAIYLHGDATHDTIENHLAAGQGANIEEIWRWNPNPTQVQFTTDPLSGTPGTPQWSIWSRQSTGGPGNTLSELVGQNAYLVKCTGTASDSYTVNLKQRVLPPASRWVRNGANLLGFPASPNPPPSLSTYFATFQSALAAGSKIYKYAGGPLGEGTNPIQVVSANAEPLDRNRAYWFEAQVTGNFYAPIEVAPATSSGLHFGRTRSVHAVRLRNRTNTDVTITVTPVTSEAAPPGQDGITGDVPITRRVFNSATGRVDETPVGSFNVSVASQSAIELEFGIDRMNMAGGAASFYASSLQFTDSRNLMEVDIPASARVTSMSGLWIGDVLVSGVVSTVAGSPGTSTLRPFPLRYLLHVDDGGTARILSQAYVGVLAATDAVGVSTAQPALKTANLDSASRFVAAHMPLDRVLAGTGSVAPGGTLAATIGLPFNDKASPFVHPYHPDHDNKNARFDGDLGDGDESYGVSRAVSFEFLATPPAGTPSTGWGATVLGGNYTETITGIHKNPLSVTGTFTFRRVNELGNINTDSP